MDVFEVLDPISGSEEAEAQMDRADSPTNGSEDLTMDNSYIAEVPNSNIILKHVCHVCGRLFPNKTSIVNHIKWKHKMENNRMCTICQKTFRDHFNLKRHLAKSHGPEGQKKTFKCPLCDYSERKSMLVLHYQKEHGFDLTGTKFEFESMADFENWKTNFELETKNKFVKRLRHRFKEGPEKIGYICNRDGFFMPSSTNKRVKNKNSNKINSHCPARINATIHEDRVEVSCIDVHVGHDFDRYSPVKGKDVKKIQKLKKDHKKSLNISISSISEVDGIWTVRTSKTDSVTLHESDISCNCALRCEDCDGCPHSFLCSCQDSSKGNMCVHSHAVSSYIKSNMLNEIYFTEPIEESDLKEPTLDVKKQILLEKFLAVYNAIENEEQFEAVEAQLSPLQDIVKALVKSNEAVPTEFLIAVPTKDLLNDGVEGTEILELFNPAKTES